MPIVTPPDAGTPHGPTVAWVESPLQLVGALEHAMVGMAAGEQIAIIPRTGDAQLELTAAYLADRLEGVTLHSSGSSTARATIELDRRIMPPTVFSEGGRWLVGDAFSGQVQARLDRAEPEHLTIVDDGAITRRMAELLATGAPLLRPRAPRLLATSRRELAGRTTRRLLRVAAEGRLSVTTYLDDADPAVSQLRALGARVVSHRFTAARALGARAVGIPASARILLGSAEVADGLATPNAVLERIVAVSREGGIAYLPHRREPRWFLRAVNRLPDVVVVRADLPIELALGGASRAVQVISPSSTAAETLPIVLAGSGSTVRLLSLDGERVA